jgi:hypothetical protein
MGRKHDRMRTDADRSVIISSESNVPSVLCDHHCADQQDEAGAVSHDKVIKEAMARSREKHAEVLVKLAKL